MFYLDNSLDCTYFDKKERNLSEKYEQAWQQKNIILFKTLTKSHQISKIISNNLKIEFY